MDGNERGNIWAVALIVALFAAITGLRALVDDPAAAVGSLYAVPIAMVAVRWGIGWGLVTAVASYVAYTSMTIALNQEISATGDVVRALLFAAAALLVGGYAERARRAERRDAERFREAIETSHEAYVAMDRDGAITAWNHEAERTFGLAAAEVLGRPVADVIVPEPMREAHWEGLRRVQSGGESRVLGKRLELTAVRAGGEEFPIEITIAPVVGRDGETSYHAFLHDISDRVEAAAEADRLKSEFFALVSHELKTPLTAVMGFQELIEQSEGDKLSDRGRRYLELIGRSGEELNTRIGDLLLVAQVEAGNFEVTLGRVDLSEVVQESVDAARAHAERVGVGLSLDHGGSAEEIEGDRRRLGQVFDNLISNALKFTPADGTVSVKDRCQATERARSRSTDTGIGIGADDREHLFDRFYRSSEARNRQIGGVGLGLSIVDAIVSARDGEVRLESEPGRRFHLHGVAAAQLTLAARHPPHRRAQRAPGACAGAPSLSLVSVLRPRRAAGRAVNRVARGQALCGECDDGIRDARSASPPGRRASTWSSLRLPTKARPACSSTASSTAAARGWRRSPRRRWRGCPAGSCRASSSRCPRRRFAGAGAASTRPRRSRWLWRAATGLEYAPLPAARARAAPGRPPAARAPRRPAAGRARGAGGARGGALVDDVRTTGATLRLRAGASRRRGRAVVGARPARSHACADFGALGGP